jgi:hypothetical protein
LFLRAPIDPGTVDNSASAPQIQSIRRIDDPIKLQQAFDAFDWWGRYRAVVQFAAFCTNVWALVNLATGYAGERLISRASFPLQSTAHRGRLVSFSFRFLNRPSEKRAVCAQTYAQNE